MKHSLGMLIVSLLVSLSVVLCLSCTESGRRKSSGPETVAEAEARAKANAEKEAAKKKAEEPEAPPEPEKPVEKSEFHTSSVEIESEQPEIEPVVVIDESLEVGDEAPDGLAVKPTDSASLAYEKYLKTSEDFRRIKQDKDWLYKQYPSWVYFAWYFQWNIGFTDEGGQFSRDHGYSGGLSLGDRNLAWLGKHGLKLYRGHVAGKGDLYLRKKKFTDKQKNVDIPGTGMRFLPVNQAMTDRTHKYIRDRVGEVKGYDLRCAYALDDEISWGSFVKPCFWQITDDKNAYPAWLAETYGEADAPKYQGWKSYNDLRGKLPNWALKDFDCAQVMDQLTFNDSYWNNYLGELSEYANTIDPDTPCGFVGGQSPNIFGGYDYAKIMRKVQYLESYNIGGSQAVIRSMNPHNAVPAVTTHFHKAVKDTVWQTWYYIAQGNRGMIGWVQDWFDGKTPKGWHKAIAPHYLEVGKKIGPLQAKSEWIHDGVAIYYSHPSIQMTWFLDAEAHGGTWRNRNGDHAVGTSHHGRKAWENMLRDEGIQFTYLSYADMVRNDGVPEDYKVLVLQGAYCLSDIEAYHIKKFCENGGTVIADFLPGVFDHRGRARKSGAVLDDMFGYKHDMNLKAADIFNSEPVLGIKEDASLWVETDQEHNFSWKSYRQLVTNKNDCIKDPSGFNKAVRNMSTNNVNTYGKGTAVLMNMGPLWYNAYRADGQAASKVRETFMAHVKKGGATPWVRIDDAGDDVFGYEITYWQKDGRTILFLISNPEVKGTSLGGGNSAGLKTDTVDVKLVFNMPLKGVRDERGEKDLPDGRAFSFRWTMNEAVVMSFEGSPYPGKELGKVIE